MDNDRKKVIIIGAGISGLTAGIFALKYGFDVEIYERNPSVGGLCTGWYRKGTYIDGCIHWLTESNRGVLNELWHEVGALNKKVRVHHYDYYSQIHYNGKDINFYTDPSKLKAELLKYATTDNDRKLIKQFIWGVKRCKHNAITVHKPYHLWNVIDVIRFIIKVFWMIPALKKFSKLSVGDFVNMLDSPELKFIFSHNICPEEYSLFSLTSTYGGIASKNSGVPIGGSKAFIERIKDTYLAHGGRLFLNHDVSKFDIDGNNIKGVRFANGSVATADYYIPACDVHFTLDTLLQGKYKIDQMARRDADKEHFPTYSGYLITYRTKKDISSVAHNRYIQCSPFEVLGRQYDSIYMKHFGYDENLSENNEYTVVQTLIVTNEKQYDMLQNMSREEYLNHKKQVAETLIQKLNETDKDTYGELELLDIASPLTYTHYVNAYKGTFMTYMLTKYDKQMIIRNDVLPIENLALAGHWMMVPGGVPIAVMQGKFAAMTIRHFMKHGRDVSSGDDNVSRRAFN